MHVGILSVFLMGCLSSKTDSAAAEQHEDTGENVLDTADSGEEAVDTGASEETDTQEWNFGSDTVTVRVLEDGPLRTYSIQSTHTQRDGAQTEREFSEEQGDPILRSGILLTDALFAMAVHEAKENAVSTIEDTSFQGVKPCECYKTGALWNWVWTRDIAYATELGLAWLDTERAKKSLLFKLSEQKNGGGLEIVQDTGTGGSWPVSTDRVTWVRGAMSVLRHSSDEDFRDTVIDALRNTAQRDKAYVFDSRDGLYFGESSFLDWREQTYPAWVQDNPVHIAMSKSLSTNLNHLFLLRSLEELTGEDHQSNDLAAAIDTHFWDGTAYRSFLHSELSPTPTHQQDLLATSLAILDLGTHPEALAQYPHSAFGAPVIFPQQQQIPIYHNRAIWPFVSSYALLAAKKADNGAIFDAQLDSLIRGAALNLSNMENLEWQTGQNWFEDGAFSGPVVNSHRQLWSVAGFLGAIVHGVFGLSKESGVWNAQPVMPSDWFTDGAILEIDGQEFSIGSDSLSEGAITYVDESDWQNLYSARVPTVTVAGQGSDISVEFSSTETEVFDVIQDGSIVAQGVSSPWNGQSVGTSCIGVVAQLVRPSHASEPLCFWGEDYQRIQTYGIEAFTVVGGSFSTNHGRPHYENWGEPAHMMEIQVVPEHTGLHYIQLVYGNGSNSVSSGITTSVKWVRVQDEQGLEVASQSIVMPQLGSWSVWGDSSFVSVELQQGESYSIVISDGRNMSYLDHYRSFNGNGGGDLSYNFVNITEMKLLFMR